MIGQLISKYVVKDSDMTTEYSYKTLSGAQHKYDKISATGRRVAIYQETTCINEYIAIASNWFVIE